jgi:hypothetical protein
MIGRLERSQRGVRLTEHDEIARPLQLDHRLGRERLPRGLQSLQRQRVLPEIALRLRNSKPVDAVDLVDRQLAILVDRKRPLPRLERAVGGTGDGWLLCIQLRARVQEHQQRNGK